MPQPLLEVASVVAFKVQDKRRLIDTVRLFLFIDIVSSGPPATTGAIGGLFLSPEGCLRRQWHLSLNEAKEKVFKRKIFLRF